MSVKEFNFVLKNGDQEVKGKLEVFGYDMFFTFEGYGDATSKNGHGMPLGVELYEGQLRVMAWADINREDPTHVISLENAKESNRHE